MQPESNEHESIAAILEATGEYRVLRRVRPRPPRNSEEHVETPRRGLIVSLTTTGPRPGLDEVIDLALVPFDFNQHGTVLSVGPTYASFREPSRRISIHTEETTGITNDMVAGCDIVLSDLDAYAERADLIVSHSAAITRPFFEALCPISSEKHWACSEAEIPWSTEILGSTDIAVLAGHYGLYSDRYWALDRAFVLLEILSRPLPVSRRSTLARLLASARMTSYRIWADDVPYVTHDFLIRRGYQWYDGSHGGGPAWFLDVADSDLNNEIALLQSDVYRYPRYPQVERVTALTRHSNRALIRKSRI